MSYTFPRLALYEAARSREPTDVLETRAYPRLINYTRRLRLLLLVSKETSFTLYILLLLFLSKRSYRALLLPKATILRMPRLLPLRSSLRLPLYERLYLP